MSIIVQKYGGSSVENKEKLEIICQKIIKEKNNNNDIVVVVSAQGKTTNNLIQKAKDYTSDENKIDKKEAYLYYLFNNSLTSVKIKESSCIVECKSSIAQTVRTFSSSRIVLYIRR